MLFRKGLFQEEQQWTAGSALVFRAVRIFAFTTAQKCKKTVEEDKGDEKGWSVFSPENIE